MGNFLYLGTFKSTLMVMIKGIRKTKSYKIEQQFQIS